jgi:Carboxypeptidase regulatory-like domain
LSYGRIDSMSLAVSVMLAVVLASPPQAAPATVRVSGRVVDAATNEPLPGVEMAFERTPSAPGATSVRAVTSRTGVFSIDIASGDYRFLARRAGYVPSDKNETPTLFTVRGRAQTMPEIRLERSGGTIAGRIVDGRGNPLPRLLVAAVRPAVLGTSDLDRAGESIRTNDRGEFRLSGLPVGRYYVAAELLPQPVASDGAASAAFVSTYYPGVTDQSAASLIEVTESGTRTGIDFSVFEAPTRSVSGTVVDGRNLPIKGAVVMFSRARQLLGISPSVITDGGGRFRMVLPEGDYVMVASIPVTTSGDGRGTGVRLGGPGVVQLTVGGDPVSDIRLVAQQNR